MRYQDLKIRDGMRLFWLGTAAAIAAGAMLALRARLLPVFDANPHRPQFGPILFGLGFLAVSGWSGFLYYLLSSPRQNAGHIDWMVRRLGSRLPSEFDPALLDPADPAWNMRTLDYWRQRRRSDRG